MATATEKRRRLRAALEAPGVIVAPGCGDPLTARLVELCGLGAIHASGSVAHRTYGHADAGILTLNEMVQRIEAISDAVDLPTIADGDTGFGAASNVIRTVRAYERAGAAAIHLEDQLTPKRPVYQEGFAADCISRREMVDKIRAAADARTDPSFVIIARSEVKGDQEEVLERLAECIAAGADCAWLSARRPEDIQAFQRRLGRPLVGVLPQRMTLEEYGRCGARVACLPGVLQIAALHAQRQLMEEIGRSGTPSAYFAAIPGIEEMQRFYNQQGNAELQEIERRYGGAG